MRKPRYALEAGGQRVDTIVGRSLVERAPHVLDEQAREVFRVARRRREWVAHALAGEAGSFTVQISLPVPDPPAQLCCSPAR